MQTVQSIISVRPSYRTLSFVRRRAPSASLSRIKARDRCQLLGSPRCFRRNAGSLPRNKLRYFSQGITYSRNEDWEAENNHSKKPKLQKSQRRRQSQLGNAEEDKRHQFQLERWEQRQKSFFRSMAEYQNVFDLPNLQNHNKPWTEVSESRIHPISPSDVTWEQLVESEPKFAELCRHCHDCFAALTALLDASQDETTSREANEQTGLREQQSTTYPLSINGADASLATLQVILPFWERIRRERTTLVQALQPMETNQSGGVSQDSANVPGLSNEQQKDAESWMGWVKNFIQSTTDDKDQSEEELNFAANLTSHTDEKYAPSHYHYAKLVGRLYFFFPNPNNELDPTEWYEERAKAIHELIEKVPHPDVLNVKIIRLLIRAYQDIGTLEASETAEEIYKQYPSRRKQLMWYVLMSYLQVVEKQHSILSQRQDKETYRTSVEIAGAATKRVCDLLLSHNLRVPGNERQSLMTIGFQCLAHTPASALDDYYTLVDHLARRKFGRDAWQALIQNDAKGSTHTLSFEKLLSANDSKTLQLLVQIYANGSRELTQQRLQRAQTLLDIIFQSYQTTDLKDSVKRSTFHSILHHLADRNKQKRNPSEEAQLNDFRYAMDNVLDRMILVKHWYPNEETWRHMFSIARTAEQAEEVLTRYEASFGLTDHYSLSPRSAAKYVLNTWLNPLQRESSNQVAAGQVHPAVSRAWALFQMLDTLSTPFFFNDQPDVLQNIYNQKEAPDKGIYLLVWRICARYGDWQVAKKVFRAHQRQQAVDLTGGIALPLVSALYHCEDSNIRDSTIREALEEVLVHEPNPSEWKGFLRTALKRFHPVQYQELVNDTGKAFDGEEAFNDVQDDSSGDRI